MRISSVCIALLTVAIVPASLWLIGDGRKHPGPSVAGDRVEPASASHAPSDAARPGATSVATRRPAHPVESIDESFFLRENFPEVGSEKTTGGGGTLRVFVDEGGATLRTLRMDAANRIVGEVRYRGSETLAVEQHYHDDGRLFRRRVLRNGRVVHEEQYR